MPSEGQFNTPQGLIDKWSLLDDESGCWIWIGQLTNSNYAKATVNYKTVLVHRFMYENFVGPIPEGLTIDHLCRNKHCINPAHMEPVTHGDNNRRYKATITDCIHGHPLSGSNLYMTPDGRRQCRACRREAVRRSGRN